MPRFRPTIEALDARTLPSAMITVSDAPTSDAVQFADESGSPTTGEAGDKTGTAFAKVAMADFVFTKKVDKSSPGLY